jgi:hypothetical protein
MNENVKTLTFVGAAAVALAIGSYANFASSNSEQEATLGLGLLFPDFVDPLKARALEVISYDQETATLHPFKVAQVKGKWVIPSHESYPADASQHLADAAANMIEAKGLNVQSEDPSKHEEYGVVDPSSKQLSAGSTGVGKRVSMQDKNNKTLADLIIGKELKDKPGLYYVRKPAQDPVYVASIKTDKFTTKFEDWIEKDLLKLNPIELHRVGVNDYSLDELRGVITPRTQISVEYDGKALKWNLIELADFEGGEFVPVKLADDEQLNNQKLNDMKTALDDLKIVDVRRKPAGLAADFKTGENLAGDEESLRSLAQRGFHIASVKNGPSEIYSNEGEVRAGMKDGVEYVLRFGRIAGNTPASGDEEKKSESDETGEAQSAGGVNRYIMVTAQFNKELVPEPELQPLPDEQPAGGEADSQGDEKAGADKPDAKQDESEQAEAKKVDAKQDGAEKKADGKPDAAKAKAERERIEKENKRLQDDYDAKLKKGEERAKELSARFADWYYVISDATYQKIHLGRAEIVEKKTPPAGEAGKDKPESENTLSDELKAPLE